MSGATATFVTTPVPMDGYEDADIERDFVYARLNVFYKAFRSRKRPSCPEPTLTGSPSSSHLGDRQFYVKGLQTAAIDWYSLSIPESATSPTDEPGLQCGGIGYLDAVCEVSISFLLAYLKAQAKGELSRPVVLRGRSSSGGKTDLRSGRWIVQSWGRLHRIAADLGVSSVGHESSQGAIRVARAFLEDVYRLEGAGDLQSATDRVFDRIDRLLCDGSFDVCDTILRQVDILRLSTALMRSFLTITAAAKAHLPSRRPLFVKIQQEMTKRKGPEMAQRLLARLA